MKYGVGSLTFVLGLLVALGGCESSSDSTVPGVRTVGTVDNTTGGSTGEPKCDFDSDKDGFCDAWGAPTAETDCDDYNAKVFPGATEAPNAIDDDCDGVIDDGVTPACALTLKAPAKGCEKATQLVAFGAGACALLDSGRVLCWGINADGALGTPDVVNAPVPIEVPGVSGATALASGPNAVCALTGAAATCWGAYSSFPFRVPLPAGTTQIALSTQTQPSGRLTYTISALSDAGQVWNRPLLIAYGEDAAAPLEFMEGETGIKQLLGGKAACWVTANDDLDCPDFDAVIPVEFAAQSFDGGLCYKSAGQLYCSTTPSKGGFVAGNASAVGAAWAADAGCAFNEAGKLACWAKSGPTTVTDATQLVLGSEFGCVLRRSGGVSCWGNPDGGRLGDGGVKPGWVGEPVNLAAAPTLSLRPIVLLTAKSLGACDTLQDLNVLQLETNPHPAVAACKDQCKGRLDSNECFGTCAKAVGLTSGCLACYSNFATCTGVDCYAKFQACAGYPVDFVSPPSNHPRFDCKGASCLYGKTVGQPCSGTDVCATGHCSKLPHAPDITVCTAANGASCWETNAFCACNLGSDFGGPTSYGHCGGCYGTGRTESGYGDCYRDCTTENYCATGQICKYFRDSTERYCSAY